MITVFTQSYISTMHNYPYSDVAYGQDWLWVFLGAIAGNDNAIGGRHAR